MGIDPLTSSPRRVAFRPGLLEIPVVFLIAGTWLFMLATWTGFRIGKRVSTRDNLVFDLDVPTVTRALMHEADPQFKSRHRLARPIWGPAGVALKAICNLFVGRIRHDRLWPDC